ncbi:MAG: T9SS type A sorting domain-containing protein [Flavobacteriales bacterium]
MRTLLYVTGIAAAAVVAVMLAAPNSATVDYTPRSAQATAQEPHAAAEYWRRMRGNIETGQVESEDLIRLRAAVAKMAKEAATKENPLEWEEMGPDNVGGRTRALLVVTEDHIISGGVSGGLWQSFNGGNNWSQMTSFPNMMIGSIARAGNGDLYVGTGSLFDFASGDGSSGYLGRGVWRSTDMGATWEILADTDPGFLGSNGWTAVEALETDPIRPNRVWVGSNQGFGYIEGTSFTAVGGGLPSQVCQDIHIAHDGSYMLVSMGAGRVYRSTDNTHTSFEGVFGGSNDPGTLPQSGMGRARVYVVPQHPDVAYALFSTTGGFFGGVYHSSDAGQTWSNIWPSGIANVTPLPRGQGIYDLTIGASPNEPNIAYVGGIEFWRCGPNYQAELAALPFTAPTVPTSMHVDIHEIVYSPAGVLWVTTDGGIYRSNNNGQTYISSNRGYNTVQYYGIDFTPTGGAVGGTQDNGSHFIPFDGSFISNQQGIDITGGDGFDAAVPQVTETDRQIAFTTSQYGVLYRASNDGAISFIYDDRVLALGNADGEIGQFYTTIQLYEDTEDELSQQTLLLINPYEETITDSSFAMTTNNMDLEFTYTLEEGDELRFWEELIRPAMTLDEPFTGDSDPNYFWLEPQELTEIILDCDTTEVQIGEQEVIDTITPIDTCVNIVIELPNGTIIEDVQCYQIGADTTYATVPIFETEIDCDTTYFYAADTLFEVREQRLIQDPYTVMLAVGFRGAEGVWMTRNALNFNTSPNWFRLGNAPGGGGTKDMEFVVGDHPEAGDVMFISGWNGQLWRVTGLRNIQFEGDDADADNNNFADALNWQLIHSSGGAAVTGIAIDPNDPNHVVITVGGYGSAGSGKVRESFNALSANPTWSNIWFSPTSEMGRMPCYDATIDVADATGNTIVVGAEYGVWITYDGGENWVMSNAGMSASDDFISAPVVDVRQQWKGSTRWSEPTNSGYIYLGTHGRGIFRNGDFSFTSVNDVKPEVAKAQSLNLFPNPVTNGTAQVVIDLAGTANVRMAIFNLQGKFVKDIPAQRMAQGRHQVALDVAELPVGTYVLAVEMGSEVKTTRFVVMK